MKKCLNCKSNVRDTDKYCRNCGSYLQSNGKYVLVNVLITVVSIGLLLMIAMFAVSYLINR